MDLLELLIKKTGLPDALIRQELEILLSAQGLKKEELNLEQLREILGQYLQETILTAKEQLK